MMSYAERRATTRTAAARIERALAVQILRGERAAGVRLPPVRRLADEFGVTVPTIQRAIAGLEAQRLVVARQGSGVTVLEPHDSAGLALVPLWFEASSAERAVEVLADFLEMRRVLAAHLVVDGRASLLEQGEELASLLLQIGSCDHLDELVELDLAYTRAVAAASGSFAARAVLVSVGDLVREVPWVAEALYGEDSGHVEALVQLTQHVVSLEGPALAQAVMACMTAWDARAVERFAAALARR